MTHENKASALILYPDVKSACQAIPFLQKLPVAAAEIMDRAALRSVENKQGVPDYLKTLTGGVTALLVETPTNPLMKVADLAARREAATPH